MILVFIIVLFTIYLSLLNVKGFRKFNEKSIRVITNTLLIFYLIGLIFYVWNFDAAKFKENSFYVLLVAFFFIWADLIFRKMIKKSE
jgi:hypothetical protein